MCKGTHPSLFNAPCSRQLARHQDFFLKKMGEDKGKGRGGREPGSPLFLLSNVFMKRLTSKDTVVHCRLPIYFIKSIPNKTKI